MRAALLRRARQLWLLPDVPASTARHNARAWARMVALLGDKWIALRKVDRITPREATP